MHSLMISAVEAALEVSNISYSRQVTGGADWSVEGAWRVRRAADSDAELFLTADAEAGLFSLVWRRAGVGGEWQFATVCESESLSSVLAEIARTNPPATNSEEWI